MKVDDLLVHTVQLQDFSDSHFGLTKCITMYNWYNLLPSDMCNDIETNRLHVSITGEQRLACSLKRIDNMDNGSNSTAETSHVAYI